MKYYEHYQDYVVPRIQAFQQNLSPDQLSSGKGYDISLVSEFASSLSEMRFAIIEQRQLPLCFPEVPF